MRADFWLLAGHARFDHRPGMYRPALIMVILANIAASSIAAPALRVPTGNWVIDYAEHQCTATRAYGTSAMPLHFLIKPSPGGKVTQITLVENGTDTPAIQKGVTLQTSDGQRFEATQLSYGVGGRRFRRINLDDGQATRLALTSSLHWNDNRAEALNLGRMTDVMKVLEDCRTDLRRYWNIESDLHAKLKRGPRAMRMLPSYFSPADYPRQAAQSDQSGTTGFIMLIDEQGRLRDCMVEQTSGFAGLDIMSCMVFAKRAKFEPAVGEDGKAVRGSITTRVRWELPGN